MMLSDLQIPDGSVVGINYSGMHDSAIAIVAPDGSPLFAVSLERLSRVKQDGRPPFELIQGIPWKRIRCVAVSTEKSFDAPTDFKSRLHSSLLPAPRPCGLAHEQQFLDFLDGIPCDKTFVGHQVSHASSAFWGSEFSEALCLTYDGGMANDPWFGGLFRCSREGGIVPLDRFSSMHYAKVTTLYTFVTALLGFAPSRHEGKVTGLAAYGSPSARCDDLLDRWFSQEYYAIESCMQWMFAYSDDVSPQLLPDAGAMAKFRQDIEGIPRESVAASVQGFAERHVLQILDNARKCGWTSDNICVAGGLFANVKINQRVVESGFARLFVAPPMTDDGTALGAAWQVLSGFAGSAFRPHRLSSMYLGPAFDAKTVRDLLQTRGVTFEKPKAPARAIAQLLQQGSVVAIYQGATEFGPRALGNRSIIAPATDSGINDSLNKRLSRTEFMPFAPVSRAEDAADLYVGIERVTHAAEFMTVTVNCTEELKRTCPAIVHVDGTARPQLVKQEVNPLLHSILEIYGGLTGLKALVNTSFNIHEEPIVCSPDDALSGFFQSGLDYLYLGDVGLVPREGNERAAVHYLRQQMGRPAARQQSAVAITNLLTERSRTLAELEEKEKVIRELASTARELEVQRADAVRSAREKEDAIQHLRDTVIQSEHVTRQLLKKADQKDAVIERLHAEHSGFEKSKDKIADAQAAAEFKEAVIQQLKGALTSANLRVEQSSADLASAKQLITALQARATVTDAVVAELKSAHAESWKQIQELRAPIATHVDELASARRTVEAARSTIREKEAVIGEIKAIQDELNSRLQHLPAIIERQGIELATCKESLREYEVRNAMIPELVDRAVADVQSRLERAQECLAEAESKSVAMNVAGAIGTNHALLGILEEKEKVINELAKAVDAYRAAFRLLNVPLRSVRGMKSFFTGTRDRLHRLSQPRLGRLYQYSPRPVRIPPAYRKPMTLSVTPKVSIITPSFRQASFIARTIDSVLDQKYPNLEYFVQDGGSTDGTVELLEKYSDRLSGWVSKPDDGQSQAINLGFARTTGDIMGWINSDDLLLPGALHCVVEYFNRHPDIDVIYGDRLLIDEKDDEIGRWLMPSHSDAVLSWADYVPQETMFWRRRIWDKAGGTIDESFKFAMDWDLLVRFRDVGARFAHIRRFLGAFRVHEQQKTSAVINDIGHREMDRIRARALGRVPDSTEIREAVRPYLVRHVMRHVMHRVGTRLGSKP